MSEELDQSHVDAVRAEWEQVLQYAGIPPHIIPVYAQKFVENDMDGNSLAHLQREHLEKMGITPLGHQIKILKLARFASTTEHDRISDYFVTKQLGEGTFHSVKLGEHWQTTQQVALKILRADLYRPKGTTTKWYENPTDHEKRLLEAVSPHPNIIRLIKAEFDVVYVNKDPTIEQYQTHMLVLERALFSLHDVISRTGPLTEDHARGWFHQIIGAIERCHARNVAHRDLKPEQILFTDQYELRLSDFNFGEEFEKGVKLRKDRRELVGTMLYMPPEVRLRWIIEEKRNRARQQGELSAQEDNDQTWYDVEAADVWGCGVILYYMVVSTDPFVEASVDCERYKLWADVAATASATGGRQRFWQLTEEMRQADARKAGLPVPEPLSEELKSLLEYVMHIDPDYRYTLNQIKSHPWCAAAAPDVGALRNELRRRHESQFVDPSAASANSADAEVDGEDSSAAGEPGSEPVEGIPHAPISATATPPVPAATATATAEPEGPQIEGVPRAAAPASVGSSSPATGKPESKSKMLNPARPRKVPSWAFALGGIGVAALAAGVYLLSSKRDQRSASVTGTSASAGAGSASASSAILRRS